jgi:hypothetical protein
MTGWQIAVLALVALGAGMAYMLGMVPHRRRRKAQEVRDAIEWGIAASQAFR